MTAGERQFVAERDRVTRLRCCEILELECPNTDTASSVRGLLRVGYKMQELKKKPITRILKQINNPKI